MISECLKTLIRHRRKHSESELDFSTKFARSIGDKGRTRIRQAGETARVGAATAQCKMESILQKENRRSLLNRKAAGQYNGKN